MLEDLNEDKEARMSQNDEDFESPREARKTQTPSAGNAWNAYEREDTHSHPQGIHTLLVFLNY